MQNAIRKEKNLKIALMGHSAGGHLALLYAYSTADNYTNQEENPIKLVISEAGPTNFVQWDEEEQLILPDNNTCAMAGVMNDDTANVKAGKLEAASPINYIDANAPYTILAYGNGVEPFSISGLIPLYNGTEGDGLIPHSHATILEDLLNPTSSQVGGGTGDNASQIIEGDNCTLFKLFEVGHEEFGEGGKVYPNTTYDDEQGINQIIYAYYDKILNKLQALAQQEN